MFTVRVVERNFSLLLPKVLVITKTKGNHLNLRILANSWKWFREDVFKQIYVILQQAEKTLMMIETETEVEVDLAEGQEEAIDVI